MRIIPAIDIIDGKCVRLTQGDYQRKTVYDQDPVELAKELEDHGMKYLHVVDLEGAKSSHIVNHRTLERITSGTNLIVDFGGGLKYDEDVRLAFDCGAAKVAVGSLAAGKPEKFLEWVQEYGPDRVVLGADGKNRQIAINGWKSQTSIPMIDFIRYYERKGVEEVICTDVIKDGMLQGPSFELYQEILDRSAVRLVASGGVTSEEDILRLREMGCDGAIIGKAIVEGRITLDQLSRLC